MFQIHYKTLLLATAILVAFMQYALSMSTEQVSRKKPHIILIVADDLGWNDASWNNPSVVMPNMHDLATNGVIMNYSYVQPTCTPTRAALMTGIYPFKLGIQMGVIRPSEPKGVPMRAKMLPHYLKKTGYETHAIGKWHLGFCSWDYTPMNRGFDSFYGFYTGASDYYTHKRATQTKPKENGLKDFLDLRNDTEPDDTKSGIYSTHLFGSVAEDIVRSRNPKDPMFMYLAFQSVHSPLQVPQNYSNIYSYIKDDNRRMYLGMVTAMDEAIGRLVTALNETGHYDNSVIIFTSDNGGTIRFGGSNWPLRGGKATLWEGGIRVPAFIHSPYLPNPGTVTNQLHHVTDWFRTIIDITGGNSPEVDGINQWDAIAGVSNHPRNKIICNMQNVEKFKAAIRIDDHKLLIGRLASVKWTSSPITTDNTKITNHRNIPPIKSKRSFQKISLSSKNDGKNINEDGESENNEYDIIETLYEDNTNISREFENLRVNDSENNETVLIDFVRWGDLKNHPGLKWNREVLRVLGKYMTQQTKIRIFNIKDDPEERNNLSTTEIYKLQEIINYLANQLQHMIPASRKRRLKKGHPIHWSNVWSSGWCQSKW